MQIDPKATINGYPLLSIRDLLRRHGDRLTAQNVRVFLSKHLPMSTTQAQELIARLEQEKRIEPRGDSKSSSYWSCTDAGRQLAHARASKPIKRATAERLLQGLLARAQEINDDNGFLYRITRIAVFGSYLTETEELGDIDFAIQLNRRIADPALFRKLCEQRIHEAQENGWQARNMVEEVSSRELEIYKVLRGRKQAISIHPYSELENLHCAFHVVLESDWGRDLAKLFWLEGNGVRDTVIYT